MKQYRVSASARADLDDIWFYIAQDDVTAADQFIHTIIGKFLKLAEWPDIGRERSELMAHLRSFVVGRYVIFYRQITNGIEVVRVLHGARDLPPIFE